MPRTNARQRYLAVGAVALVVIVAAFFLLRSGGRLDGPAKTFTVARGDLEVTVLEGGNIQALESQDIRSEVKGHQGVKILRIVEEGYVVTQQDIADGTVLVELDSAELVDRHTDQRIIVQTAEAAYIEALQSYEIQASLNESTVKLAELTVKFAHMDFEKFLGEKLAAELLNEIGLDEMAERIRDLKINTNLLSEGVAPAVAVAPRQETPEAPREIPLDDEMIDAIVQSMGESGRPIQPERFKQMLSAAGGKITPEMADRMKRWGIDVYAIAERQRKVTRPEPAVPDAPSAPIQMDIAYTKTEREIDFSKYADADRLGDGGAKQRLRELEDDLIVAREEYTLAKTQLDGKKRLAEKNFVTQSELDAERVRVNKSSIAVDSAETELLLYRKYEFTKQAERLLSEYEDALRELERMKKTSVSLLAQASAKLKSAELKHSVEQKKYIDLEDQIEKCTIRATRPGLVVYAGQERPWDQNAQIQEGATVRQQQMILTIPDLNRMAVEVKVHESAINRVARGQKARIRVDARAQETLEGEVVKVSVLPDSQNRWMNPDVKLFTTAVRIDGLREWMRPGMSAEVEILVGTLEDVVYVPLNAVFVEGEEKVCYVTTAAGAERRTVETGAFTEDFVEIVNGVTEGEEVYLRVPDGVVPQTAAPDDASASAHEGAPDAP